MRPRRAGIVLCGGLSSRMGRAKAWLPWFGDQVMLEHVVNAVGDAVDEVIVVRSAGMKLPSLMRSGSEAGSGEVRVVTDSEPARGPLAGIRDGLAATDAAAAFVTSTDAPFLTSAYIDALFDRSEGQACAPVEDDFVQVLSAVYPGDADAAAQVLLDADQGRPRALLESLRYRVFDGPAGRPGRRPWTGFNTPEAYLAGVREIDPEASAVLVLGEGVGDSRVRVPVGTLEEVLENGAKALGLRSQAWKKGAALSEGFCVRLDHSPGEPAAGSLALPVGPGESVTLLTSSSANEMNAENSDLSRKSMV